MLGVFFCDHGTQGHAPLQRRKAELQEEACLLIASISVAQQLLWGCIGKGALHGSPSCGAGVLQDARSAHIRDFGHCCVLAQQHILGLQVVMCNL